MSGSLLSQLGTLARDLDVAVRELARLEEQAAEAEAAYRVTKARAFMRATGPQGTREAQAILESETQLLERERSSALVRVQREHIRSLHTRIDVGRTLAATDRAISGVGV